MVSAATGYAAEHNVLCCCVQGCLVQREAFAVLQQELGALRKHMQALHEQRTWHDGVYDGCGCKHW